MFFLTRKALSRRTVLRGAGTALALPLLDAMIPAGAHAAPVPKPRVACMYMAHGAILNQWTPAGGERDFTLSPTLASLSPHREYLTVVSDLDLPAARVGPNSAGDNHNRSSACWLTAAPMRKGPTPCSFDQLVAQRIGQETALPSLELALDGGVSISFLTPTTALPMELNPRIVFERLFGTASNGNERAMRQRQSASLLDSLTGQVGGLQKQLPASDRERLDRYLEDVREIERRLELSNSKLPEGVELPTKPVGIPDDFEEHAHLMIDLIALAWQADLTRVTTLLLTRELGNTVFPKSGIAEPHHACSHHSELPDKIALYARMNAYHTQALLKYTMDRLRSTPDGDGNLLDHSLVLYGSGMSNSNNHDHDPLPLVLAGKASGRVQGNRHVRAGRGTPMANLLLSMLDALDVPADSFGESNGRITL